METRTIYLVRHGRIQLPDEQRRYIGHTDIPLNETGIMQARCLKTRIAMAGITAVYCSDLSRTRRTAEIIAGDQDIRIFARPDLREVHMGEWEGRLFSDIEEQFPGEFRMRGADIVHYRVPGGESFSECNTRVLAAFREVLHSSVGDILIVGHAGVNRMILCYSMGEPLANMFTIRQEYGCLNIIQQNGAGYQVVVMDNSCH